MFSWQISNNLPKYLGGRCDQLHLVELDYHKILKPLKGEPTLKLSHTKKKRFLVVATKWKRISKIMKLNKLVRVTVHSDPVKRGNATLIEPMRYKAHIFTDEFVQCVLINM